MKKIKLSEYFKIIKPRYVYLRLKPNNSIRNQGTHKIARAISFLYKNLIESVKKEEEKLFQILGKEFAIGTKVSYEARSKVAYYIYIEKKKVEFYFIVPSHYEIIIREKISDVWNSVTIDEVKSIPNFSEDATKYQLSFEKEDALSLAVDRRNNDLLHSNLNIVEVLEEGDRVGIVYNFMPVSQFSWRSSCKNTMDKLKRGLPVERNKFGVGYVFKMAIATVDGLVNNVSEVLAGKKKEDDDGILFKLLDRLNGGRSVNDSTIKKGTAPILNTQIIVISESKDKLRERNNGRSLAQSFETISEDNRLVHKPFKKPINLTKFSIGTEVNKVSDEETQNFISLAGREVLERYNFIDRIETQETEVPGDLQKGVMRIGENTFRGHKQMAYLSTDKEFKNLTHILIGPNRAGKSTLLGNLSYDAIQNGETVVLFDYIKNCELSDEIAALFPPEKVLTIDCSDPSNGQGLGYNEIQISDDPFIRYKNAKQQTAQLQTLINSINSEGTNLTSRMERFLESAALVVFLLGGSIKDVFDVLQNHKKRMEFVERVPEEQMENMDEYLSSLEELNEYKEVTTEAQTKNGKTKIKESVLSGTKDHLISGVIDRLTKLKANALMELMLKKGTENNLDLTKEIQKPQLICIKMPESDFFTKGEKDICTTYWITKLWLALQVRGQKILDRSKHTKVNMIIDEIYQVETTEKFLKDKMSQMAKFGVKPILSCHYINQLTHIREELRSASASYMLIAGCDKKNFAEFKSELYPFQEEDLLNLPRYHSMNLIKNTEGYARFITKLPKPIN
jgi:hypothetical protein